MLAMKQADIDQLVGTGLCGVLCQHAPAYILACKRIACHCAVLQRISKSLCLLFIVDQLQDITRLTAQRDVLRLELEGNLKCVLLDLMHMFPRYTTTALCIVTLQC